MPCVYLHSLCQEHNQGVEQGLGACWNMSADSTKHSPWPLQSFGCKKHLPHFTKPENSASWESILWDVTPSSVAEISDIGIMTAASTKIPALCNLTLCRRVFPEASNDMIWYI